jgi:hypothetical protein
MNIEVEIDFAKELEQIKKYCFTRRDLPKDNREAFEFGVKYALVEVSFILNTLRKVRMPEVKNG